MPFAFAFAKKLWNWDGSRDEGGNQGGYSIA